MGTINPLVIGAILFLVIINIFLVGMGSSYIDESKIPDFIGEPLGADNLEEYDTPEGLSFFKSMTFGYFINVDTIEQASVRWVLRIILLLIFQMIPLLIIIFAGLDYIRGIG